MQKNIASIAIALTLAFASTSLKAEDVNVNNTVKSPVEYLNKLKDESLKTSENFGKLVVQSNGGRMKPLSTLNREIIQKIKVAKLHY